MTKRMSPEDLNFVCGRRLALHFSSGGAVPGISSNEHATHFTYSGINFNVVFYPDRDGEMHISVGRDSINGLIKKMEEGVILTDYVRQKLDEFGKSNAKLRRVYGYIEDKKVTYEMENLLVEARLKRVPHIGESLDPLFSDLWGILIRPLLRLG